MTTCITVLRQHGKSATEHVLSGGTWATATAMAATTTTKTTSNCITEKKPHCTGGVWMKCRVTGSLLIGEKSQSAARFNSFSALTRSRSWTQAGFVHENAAMRSLHTEQ